MNEPPTDRRGRASSPTSMSAPDLAPIRLAYLLTGDRAVAEDIAQDAFVRVVGHLGHLRDASSFDAYLRRTVVNLSKNHFRRRAVERRFLARAAEPEPVPRSGGCIDRPPYHRPRSRSASAAPACGDRAPLLRGPARGRDRVGPPMPSGNRPLTRSARCPDAPIRPQGGHRCLATPHDDIRSLLLEATSDLPPLAPAPRRTIRRARRRISERCRSSRCSSDSSSEWQ